MKCTGWTAALILANSLLTPPALAGGESSAGGADDYRVVPAFFRNWDEDRTVLACFESTEGFGVDRTALREMLTQAFREWSSYLRQKRLHIVPGKSRILTRLELRDSCQGDENLRVYFGVENELVRKYRSQFSRPFGFAQLLEVDQWGENGRGFIWIAPSGYVEPSQAVPQWSPSTQDALRGLVLHELGHVFGNGHIDGTVMTERIGEYLKRDSAPSQTSRNVALYSQIDSQVELVPCLECRMAYSAAETFDPIQGPGHETQSDWVHAFELLVGEKPLPPLMIRFERLGSPQGSGMLTFMDGSGSYDFPIDITGLIAERKDSTPLFMGQGDTSFYSFGISYSATLRTLTGRELPVAVNYNMDGKKAVILPLTGPFYRRPIFVSAN